MKNVVFVLIALIAFNVQAQKGEHARKGSNMTPEQMATMRTKQMTLALDMSDAQQKDVLALNLKNAEKFSKARGERKELTEEERYEMKNKMLDMQIANQRAMKNILNEEQFGKWRKIQNSRNAKMKKHFAQRRGKHKGKSEHHKKDGEHKEEK